MPYISTIKTPYLAKEIDMSVRQLRRYESGESIFTFIPTLNYEEERDKLLFNAKVGVLIERCMNANTDHDFPKEENTKPLKELQRLAKVGEKYGPLISSDLLQDLIS
ncbi:MAG: hypothetical protein ABXS91_08505 [Sulfurimonas sp.]